jgi:hypothetical protein
MTPESQTELQKFRDFSSIRQILQKNTQLQLPFSQRRNEMFDFSGKFSEVMTILYCYAGKFSYVFCALSVDLFSVSWAVVLASIVLLEHRPPQCC